MKRYTGFTLAETLIVIGIIGVVAALTLPNLNHATGDKERVTRVKKIYSALSDAYGRAEANYGPVDEWFNNIDQSNYSERSEVVGKRISEFMKVSKDCGEDDGCFSPSYVNYTENSGYMVLLADGTSVRFRPRYNDYCVYWDDKEGVCTELKSGWVYVIEVDIDGPNKGQDWTGRDLFEFALSKDLTSNTYSVVPDGLQRDNGAETEGSFNGMYATWILQNDNAAYLKCREGLDWDTATTCDQAKNDEG